jgi:hypothetical protein
MSALGQKQTCAPQNVVSALPPKADMCSALARVCSGPKADIGLIIQSLDRREREQDCQFDLTARTTTSKKILRHIVNRETRRHDCAYSLAGGVQ